MKSWSEIKKAKMDPIRIERVREEAQTAANMSTTTPRTNTPTSFGRDG